MAKGVTIPTDPHVQWHDFHTTVVAVFPENFVRMQACCFYTYQILIRLYINTNWSCFQSISKLWSLKWRSFSKDQLT